MVGRFVTAGVTKNECQLPGIQDNRTKNVLPSVSINVVADERVLTKGSAQHAQMIKLLATAMGVDPALLEIIGLAGNTSSPAAAQRRRLTELSMQISFVVNRASGSAAVPVLDTSRLSTMVDPTGVLRSVAQGEKAVKMAYACPTHMVMGLGSAICTHCEAGKQKKTSGTLSYGQHSDARQCTICGPGQFSDAFIRAFDCTDCPHGRADTDQNPATPCASPASDPDCNKAPSLHAYASTMLRIRVKQPLGIECPSGKFSNGTAATVCEICPEGKGSYAGASTCDHCAPTYFAYLETAGLAVTDATLNALQLQPLTRRAVALGVSKLDQDVAEASIFDQLGLSAAEASEQDHARRRQIVGLVLERVGARAASYPCRACRDIPVNPHAEKLIAVPALADPLTCPGGPYTSALAGGVPTLLAAEAGAGPAAVHTTSAMSPVGGSWIHRHELWATESFRRGLV